MQTIAVGSVPSSCGFSYSVEAIRVADVGIALIPVRLTDAGVAFSTTWVALNLFRAAMAPCPAEIAQDRILLRHKNLLLNVSDQSWSSLT